MVILFLGVLYSCSNDDKNETYDFIEHNVSIRYSDNFEYDLGGFGDEEGAGIRTQAEHFDISELDRDINTGQVIYRYKALEGFVGNDFVEIITGRGGSSLANPNTDITIVKITFTITE